jgi:hypothetical protein
MEPDEMKMYTYVVVNMLTGQSQVLPRFPGHNPRSRLNPFKTFEDLQHDGWRPIRETPMGGMASVEPSKTPVNLSLLVLMEKEVMPEEA